MRLLFLFLFLTPAVISTQLPDIHARDVSSSSNPNLASLDTPTFVYPTNPSDAYDLDQAGIILENLYGSDNVIQDHDENGDMFWKVTLQDGYTLDTLKRLKEFRFEGSDQLATRKEKPKRALFPRDTGLYMAVPADPSNTEQVQATRVFLNGKVADPALINEIKFKDQVLLWGHLQLDDAAKAEVEANAGVKGLRIDGELVNNRAIARKEPAKVIHGPHREAKPLTSRWAPVFKRAITWKKQTGATADLIMDSAFPGSPRLRNFVFDSKAGEDIWIYVVDNGVAVGVQNNNPGTNKNELITPNLELFIQTPLSVKAGQAKDTDDDSPAPGDGNPGSHGTMLAVKAAGNKYGIAKKATIIPVKIVNEATDMIEGFAQIYDHIVANNRASKSVIVCSKGTLDPTTRDAVINDPSLSVALVYFNAIIDLGTPIVYAAGNQREGTLRNNIDSFPQVLQDENTPLILVGAAKKDGGRKEDSQGEPSRLTIHAPGEGVFALKKDSKTELFDGTSVAAPAVAGLIATYLAQGVGPWEGKSGKERVTEIRNYLQSDLSSYVRKQDNDNIRVIWNGADEAAHNSATSACAVNSRKRQEEEGDGTEPTDCSEDPAPPVSTSVPPVPEPTIVAPTPEPTPPPPPKAACKVLEQGLGAGKWEVSGGGWGNDGGAKLSADLGADDFTFTAGGTDGFEWTATFVSEKSVDEIQNIVNADAGVTVTCTM